MGGHVDLADSVGSLVGQAGFAAVQLVMTGKAVMEPATIALVEPSADGAFEAGQSADAVLPAVVPGAAGAEVGVGEDVVVTPDGHGPGVA